MKLFLNLFASLIHVVLTYGLFLTALVTTNLTILTIGLLTLLVIRYSYYIHGRCILTLAEENDCYPPIVSACSSMLTQGLDDKMAEEIIINLGILIVINKLFFLMLLRKHTDWFEVTK